MGGTPSTSKKRGCTVIDWTSAGSPSGPAMVAVAPMANVVMVSNERARVDQAANSAGEGIVVNVGPRRSQAMTSRSGLENGSGRSSAASASAKMALLAPVPNASVATTMAANPGARRS
jgi:hypothetical protein